MKKMRKLIPALCMLLLSATMLTTSTFAWFSMNKSVTATGMEITAKSDNIFLLINDTNTPATGNTSYTFTGAQKALYPAAIETLTDAGDPTKWYTAAGESRENGTIKADSKTALTSLNFDEYVIKKTVYLTLAKGSKTSGALTVQATDFVDNIGGASKVIVVCGSNAVEITAAAKTPVDTLADSVTADACVQVDIYFYFDGNDTDITTANFEADALQTASVDLQFDIAEP